MLEALEPRIYCDTTVEVTPIKNNLAYVAWFSPYVVDVQYQINGGAWVDLGPAVNYNRIDFRLKPRVSYTFRVEPVGIVTDWAYSDPIARGAK